MSRQNRIARLLLLAGLLCLMGCRSTDEFKGLKTQLMKTPKNYRLVFEGVSSFSRGLLQIAAKEDLSDFEAAGFQISFIDDAAYSIENFYRGRGFPFTEVAYELSTTAGELPLVSFRINEGPRCTVADVRLTGNERISNRDLRSLLGGPTTRLFGLGELYYVADEASSARSSMERLYYQRGYIKVQIDGPEVSFSESRREAFLEYHITEGPRFAIEAVDLVSQTGHEDTAMVERLASFVGRPYFPRLNYEVCAAAASILIDQGYADAYATAKDGVDDQTGEVRMEISLHPGEQVRLAEIIIEGNEKTRDSFILDVMDIEIGALVRRADERRAFRDLYASGLFDSVSIDLEGSGPERTLRVRVEEAETLSFMVEGGYGSFERMRLLVGVTEHDLFGTGRSLTFRGKLAVKARGVSLFYKDPYTINKENVLGMNTFFEKRQLVSFDQTEYGAGFNLTRLLTESYRNIYGYEYRISEASSVQIDIPDEDPLNQSDVGISTVYLTNVYDSRDSSFLPTKGTWFRLRNEIAPAALASELTFFKLDGRIVYYQPLDEDNYLAGTIRGGVIAPMGDTSGIPIQERFFNGGQNTVRSFRDDELGPKDSNNVPIGGEAYSVFSIEYRRQLPGSFSAAVFVDAGNVSLDYEDALRFDDMRYGVGPGLRWLLPIGPLRLDWGINPSPRPNEEDWVLQFSLGIAF
jgi:outer membrane protein insertion porin family